MTSNISARSPSWTRSIRRNDLLRLDRDIERRWDLVLDRSHACCREHLDIGPAILPIINRLEMPQRIPDFAVLVARDLLIAGEQAP
jgi:hypothetical protein